MKTVIAGSSGRMGRMLVEAVLASDDLQLHGALDVAGSPALGQDAGAFLGRATGVAISADVEATLAGADVLIDFTRPEGTLAHLAACNRLGVKAVVGTIGVFGTNTHVWTADTQTVAERSAWVAHSPPVWSMKFLIWAAMVPKRVPQPKMMPS